MTWLETILGIAPDGGNGMTEAVLAIAAMLVVAGALAARHRWRSRRAQ